MSQAALMQKNNTNHRRVHADGAGNGPIRAEVGGANGKTVGWFDDLK